MSDSDVVARYLPTGMNSFLPDSDPNISYMVIQTVMQMKWAQSAQSHDHAEFQGSVIDQVFANLNKVQVENDIDDLLMFWIDSSKSETCTATCKLVSHTVEGVPEILPEPHIHFIHRVGYAAKQFLDGLRDSIGDDEAVSPW